MWAGIGLRAARSAYAALAGELSAVEAAGTRCWFLTGDGLGDAERAPVPSVRLLPRFDAYLLGHRGRDLVLPPAHASRIQAGGGILHPAVLADGLVVGRWRLETAPAGLQVGVEPFAGLDDGVLAALADEVRDLARFLGRPATLAVAPP